MWLLHVCPTWRRSQTRACWTGTATPTLAITRPSDRTALGNCLLDDSSCRAALRSRRTGIGASVVSNSRPGPGAILAAVNLLLNSVRPILADGLGALPPLMTACILTMILVALIRALHLDGFMDCCDALLGGFDRSDGWRSSETRTSAHWPSMESSVC